MSDRALRWWLRAAVAAPLLLAALLLARRPWYPVLDLAMTELRVRDVGGPHTPLIGLPGRIGRFPDQGSHPGPLSFYLLAVVYRLTGSGAVGLLVGSVVINISAAWTALWVVGRRSTRREVIGVGVFLATLMAWLGAGLLSQPWNPYLPLVPFVVVLLSGWMVLRGDHRMAVVQAIAAALCAQTHVPYLTLCVTLVALSLGVVAWRLRAPDGRRETGVSLIGAVGVSAVLWAPVFVEEWRRDPGNITMLRRHFLEPPEAPQGLGVGVRTVLEHFDILHVATKLLTRSDGYLPVLDDLAGGSALLGGVVLLVWLATAVVAWQRGDRSLLALHALIALATAVAVASTARIFGKVWYYLTLWSWSLGLLAALAVALTVAGFVPGGTTASRIGRRVAGAALVVVTALSALDAVRVDPPEDHLSAVLGALVEPTVDAIRTARPPAIGADGVYVVAWADAAYFGSQGYGLVSELERRGVDARAFPPYRVPMTPRRTATAGEVDAELVLVTGSKIARWSRVPGVVMVADVDLRSDAERAEFAALRATAMDGLRAAGLDELVPLVDENLFGASIDPRLPAAVSDALAEMLLLGQRTVVFMAPPGSFDANP